MNWVRARDGSWVNLDHVTRVRTEQRNDGWHVLAAMADIAAFSPVLAVHETHAAAAAYMASLVGDGAFKRIEDAKLFDPDYVKGDGR